MVTHVVQLHNELHTTQMKISDLEQAQRVVRLESQVRLRGVVVGELMLSEGRFIVTGLQVDKDSTRVFPRMELGGSTLGHSNDIIRCMFDLGCEVGFTRCQNQVRIMFP